MLLPLKKITSNNVVFDGQFNPSHPNPGRREKIKLNFIFTLLCGTSKGFMKALKVVIKPFEEPQRSVKINILSSFFSLCPTMRVEGLRKLQKC